MEEVYSLFLFTPELGPFPLYFNLTEKRIKKVLLNAELLKKSCIKVVKFIEEMKCSNKEVEEEIKDFDLFIIKGYLNTEEPDVEAISLGTVIRKWPDFTNFLQKPLDEVEVDYFFRKYLDKIV